VSGINLQALVRAVGGDIKGNGALVPGPNHSAADRSLSVQLRPDAPDGFVVHSFAGDDPIICKDYIRASAGLPAFQPHNKQRQRSPEISIDAMVTAMANTQAKPSGQIVASYDYTDEYGEVMYQVLRYEPKTFRQRSPDGSGGWTWSVGERRVPYRWPELRKFPDATIFVCEGEKDADRLAGLGHCATTVASGTWTTDCVQTLKGRDIIILEDNDEPGRKKSVAAAQALQDFARSLRIVLLPNLAEGADVSDWLDADSRRAEQLVDVCLAKPFWQPVEAAAIKTEIATQPQEQADARPPLRWLDMTSWDRAPVPQRKWAIRDRVPLNQAGLFSGEGGTGKSIIELMKAVAHVSGKDWLGSMPELGPAFYLGAEDDADEIHIRLASIAEHYGVTFADLTAGGLRVLPLLGEDATLCAVGKSGRVEATDLYRQIYEAAGDIKPKNISVDTLSRAFAGNEIDRTQVYQFAMFMQALAKVAAGSVTVLAHPSLAGIASGSGISGSTAWHGAFRFRQYLKGVKAEGGEQPESDLRELEFKKNQYGPLGESIVLRYQRGLFLPEAGVSDLDKAERDARACEVFLDILQRFAREGRNVSENKNAPTYAPAKFEKEAEAKKYRLKKHDLEQAMRDLFRTQKIRLDQYDRPHLGRRRLAIAV
jgi:RecA-family ATPase